MTDTYEASVKRSLAIEQDLKINPQNYRVLTGERPTGRLHLGHLFGSLQARVRFQQQGVPTAIVIADYQVITDRDTLDDVQNNVYGIVADNLAAGLDPEKTMLFCHSQVPELNQLLLPFLALVSEAELRRNPTVKAETEAAGRTLSGLMLTYPVHQAADILFCKGNLVPVGKDQLPHLEIARVVARRFNERFGGVDYGQSADGRPRNFAQAVFPEPDALLSKAAHVPGLDGRKMSKSFGNAVYLGMTADETAALIKKSPTDAERQIAFDPENRPGVSALLTTTALCRGLEANGESEAQIAAEINADPKFGAGLLKKKATEAINEFLAPHRARRAEIERDADAIKAILRRGNARAREVAAQTLGEVQRAMGTVY
ncbi:tryptophan--tRNA ligase [Planctomycetales bacterium]|nr:tryptophan--tRNA ligase [Planctomycetales bacterium]